MFVLKVDDDIALKFMELKDADRVYNLTEQSREYLREWLPWVDNSNSVEDTKAFIYDCLRGYAENKCLVTYILYKGEIVGVTGFNSINGAHRSAQIGYWLGKDYQGRGIMTRAVRAIVDYGFTGIGLNPVEIHAAVKNVKSRSIPEKLGFLNEGCIRQAEWLYDHYVDHMVYGILAEEWKNKNGASSMLN